MTIALKLPFNPQLLECCQALGIRHTLMSASDPQQGCRAFVETNHDRGVCKKPTHWFQDLESQLKGKPCLYHSSCGRGCNAAPESVDFALLGTPCHPYSTQRTGRWNPESVENHHEYQVAMKSFFDWLRVFSPCTLVFEQVPGFDKPFCAGSQDTPYRLSLGFADGFAVLLQLMEQIQHQLTW